jgi:hypothetical protein
VHCSKGERIGQEIGPKNIQVSLFCCIQQRYLQFIVVIDN